MSNLIANTFPARPTQGGRFNPDMLIGAWKYQPKYNGWRAFIDLPEDQVFNRHGEPMSIGDCFKRAIDSIRHPCLDMGIRYLDAEALERRFDACRGALVLFDLPDIDQPFEIRQEMLSYVADTHEISMMPEPNSAIVAPTMGELEARGTWVQMQALNNAWGFPIYEGIVAKKSGSEYPTTWKPTDTFKDWVKFRFDEANFKDRTRIRSGMGDAIDNYAAMHGIDHMR